MPLILALKIGMMQLHYILFFALHITVILKENTHIAEAHTWFPGFSERLLGCPDWRRRFLLLQLWVRHRSLWPAAGGALYRESLTALILTLCRGCLHVWVADGVSNVNFTTKVTVQIEQSPWKILENVYIISNSCQSKTMLRESGFNVPWQINTFLGGSLLRLRLWRVQHWRERMQ